MSLFNKVIEYLFSNNQRKVEPQTIRHNYMANWENERDERIKNAELSLKDWVVPFLVENKVMPFSWESGGDEAFVTFNDKTDANEGDFEDLEEYIIDKLEIPDAGEFQMNGSGEIYITEDLVRVKYNSTMKDVVDYDEETEQEIFSEDEIDNGDKVLFAI